MITKQGQQLLVRWREDDDLSGVVALLQDCFPEEDWTAERVLQLTTPARGIIKVLSDEERSLYGVLHYRTGAGVCHIEHICVRTRRQGLGSFLLYTLTKPRSLLRCKKFVARVNEYNWEAQEFFKSMHFSFDPEVDRQKVDGADLYEFVFTK